MSIFLYLQRLGIVDPRGDFYTIQLHGEVPAPAVLFLSTTTFTSEVIFYCDLYFVVEYDGVLQFPWTSAIISVNITIPKADLNLLNNLELPGALRRFLSSLSRAPKCRDLTIGLDFIDGVLPRTIRPRERPTKAVEDYEISRLMRVVTQVSLSSILLDQEQLSETVRLLLTGPRVTSLYLGLDSRANADKVLSGIFFPTLKHLYIASSFPVAPSIIFLRRHAQLHDVHILGYCHSQPEGQEISEKLNMQATESIPLPNLSWLCVSSYFHSWLPAMVPYTPLDHIRLSPINFSCSPMCSEFCDVMQDIVLDLESLIKNFNAKSLIILFPPRLHEHHSVYHKDSNVCGVPPFNVMGFEQVTLDLSRNRQPCSTVC